jgi:hypothetical protein
MSAHPSSTISCCTGLTRSRAPGFDSLMIEQDLFGTGRVDWRQLGQGEKLVEIHEDEFARGQALEALTQPKP